ncbi:MAG: ATP-binding protein [Myxococcales bacterium]|nr:ATP-binding protein [Myxococcales bacterium]
MRQSGDVERSFWTAEIARGFAARSIVWLAGVRRSGKTTLVRALDGASYHDCELVRVRRALEEPELFFRHAPSRLLVLDEVHRLQNPSEVLKVAADHFPGLRVVATGSSTLGARTKFKDALTGRKRDVWLVPMLAADLGDFGSSDLDRRMLRGGLPPFFLAARHDDKDYEEWITSYWAKDLSELYVVDKRAAFMKFVELVFTQSGGLFEAQSFAVPCEVSRTTIQHWLSILEDTLLASVIRPYHGGAATEIKSQPKVYAFDTGFVAYFRGWDSLRDDDRGHLLEHLVLGEVAARFGTTRLHYWRDKQQHEVDFVLEVGRRRELVALECKSAGSRLDPAGLRAFRRKHPGGRNLVVTLHPTERRRRSFGDLEVELVPYLDLPALLDALRD